MLKTNLIIAIRTLLKEKVNFIINTGGLAVSFACVMLILTYVFYELSYDRFHTKADRIFRVATDEVLPNGTMSHLSNAPGPVGPALQTTFPEVEQFTRLAGATMLMQYGEHKFQEDHIYFADASVFDVFDFKLTQGDPETALANPNTIVLTQSSAIRYFGDEDPIGRSLLIDREVLFKVTGIIEDPPAQSHIGFDMLLSMSTRDALSPGWLNTWEWSAYTYILLSSDARAEAVEDKLAQFVKAHTGTHMMPDDKRAIVLQPLTDLHLHSNRTGEPGIQGNINYLYAFLAIALLILVIASVNFINLSTVYAARRAKEVGLRKTIGATRSQLVKQFLLESVIVSLGASLLAIGICEATLPLLRSLVGVPVTIDALFDLKGVSIYLMIVMAIGLTAGVYPALVLSGFKPVAALKGQWISSPRSIARESLIVFQFAVSIALIVGTIVVYNQIHYMRNFDLGYNRDQVVVISIGDDDIVQGHIHTVVDQLKSGSFVHEASASSQVPGRQPGAVRVELLTGTGASTSDMARLSVDYDFIDFYQLQLVSGRQFNRAFAADSIEALVINESACNALGVNTTDIVGRELNHGNLKGIVIGVVKDFHFASLHSAIAPLIMRMRSKSLSYISLRLPAGDVSHAMGDIEKRWNEVAPHRPFDYFFPDQQFDYQYRADIKFGKVFAIAAALAIILASLGLFALVSFTVQQRTKELGIRKVLGASIRSVLSLLCFEFLKPIVVAFFISCPIIWLLMHKWLQDFAYHGGIEWWMFVSAAVASTLIALTTISVKAIRAAKANPVQQLQ
ncbi:MAG: ABC transporter permease [Chryseolinea sp.]